ncbi:MAG: sensor histidine kinase inhibitor, KipI family [Marmoricola sp.]|nr:sensor histidine kinase inhibitor, KipI family [Marmoricola sp.]
MGNNGVMDARTVGEHALLVTCADADEVAATYAVLRARVALLGAVEVVPAARTVLLDGLADPYAVRDLIAGWVAEPVPGAAYSGAVEIPTIYDGEDLAEVARQWSTTTGEVVRIHQGCTFVVAFCGFAPGFAYCTGLPDGLTVRRRDDPRARVAPGSVALAGEYTAVYPTASPGGWQLIGRSAVPLWVPEREQPALLSPGTSVRFVDA